MGPRPSARAHAAPACKMGLPQVGQTQVGQTQAGFTRVKMDNANKRLIGYISDSQV